MKKFNNKSFQERLNESNNFKINYPNRIPVIIKSEFDDFEKFKFLAPDEMKLIQLIYIIKKRKNINMTESYYIFTEDKNLMSGTTSISNIYNLHKNKDGFLYLYLNKENTFGNYIKIQLF